MIVDLMRNDLGRVCEYGSVRVDSARAIESHPTIHHGVATVAGRLHPSKDVVDLLKAAFPGGSVTGAPKVRAMQIIDELEPHARGPYCGCIGYLSKDSACLNIAIRTMMLSPAPPLPKGADRRSGTGFERAATVREQTGGDASSSTGAEADEEERRRWTADLPVGGGIVADSDPAAEYDETLDKARAMLKALGVEDMQDPLSPSEGEAG
jgi:anthranilate/para-aminobenzoate synthase component I